MKKQSRKLALNRETIQTLQHHALVAVAGGVIVTTVNISNTGCPTEGVCSTAAFSVCYTQCGSHGSENGF